jgi:hypothetical protein
VEKYRKVEVREKWMGLLEKFLETSMVVRMAPFSFRLALNFFKQSTVSCLEDDKDVNQRRAGRRLTGTTPNSMM